MRRHLVPAAFTAVAAAALLSVSPAHALTGGASAGNVLTYGGAAGSAVAVGDTLTASLAPGASATIRTTAGGSTGITCSTSAFTAKVSTNPAAPGSATESLTAHTFGGCTTNILGATGVQSFTVDTLPLTTTATSAGALTVAGPIQTTVKLTTALGPTTCVYTGPSLSGTTSNTGNTITFTNQAFTKKTGPASCPSTGYFSAVYGPVKDTSKTGSPSVWVN
ncbi:Tat pathway signal sequence domain protein [Streptomyces sp. NPDC007088]|uniref:Tat pathway signal sequence domain protein n=1 Tax=Streptomyces sp. NPDC007088 TaxID=3364773 RepID=UPI0036B9F402